MGTHVIGHGRYREIYPEPRFTGLVGPFARNSAATAGPDSTIPGTPGSQIVWNSIESGGSGVHVPITPKNTGIIRVLAALTLKNTGLTPANITVNLQVDDVTQMLPIDEEVTILPPNPDQTYVTIPLLVSGLALTKALHNISILLTSSTTDSVIFLVSATLDVQEVAVATG